MLRVKNCMNIITLSTLIRMKPPLAIDLIKSHVLKWHPWHRNADVEGEIKSLLFFSAECFIEPGNDDHPVVYGIEKEKEINDLNGKRKDSKTTCHF